MTEAVQAMPRKEEEARNCVREEGEGEGGGGVVLVEEGLVFSASVCVSVCVCAPSSP